MPEGNPHPSGLDEKQNAENALNDSKSFLVDNSTNMEHSIDYLDQGYGMTDHYDSLD